MSTEYEFENDISKIELPPGVTLDEETLAALQDTMKDVSGCVNFGPLSLCYSIVGTDIVVTATVFGIRIGRVRLSPTKPCAKISINLYLVSGSIELCLKDRCLTLSGKVCKLGNCARWNNVRVVCF